MAGLARLITAFLVACASACATADVEQHATHSDPGLSINFVSHGSGEPVVLVHGFSQTHKAWLHSPLYEALVREHRIIAVDLRGHGDSDKPHDPQAYGQNLALDLVELLDHLGIDKAHFVGFSLGASVVGGVVVTNPERVQTATMGSGFFPAWDESEEDFARLTENRAEHGELHPWEPENQDFQALAAVIRGARYASVTHDQIMSVSTPTLMVFGSIELEHMSELQKERLGELPGSIRTLIIEGADHDSSKAAILSPEFTQAVIAFIASHPSMPDTRQATPSVE